MAGTHVQRAARGLRMQQAAAVSDGNDACAECQWIDALIHREQGICSTGIVKDGV
jgi:hypothetical protein